MIIKINGRLKYYVQKSTSTKLKKVAVFLLKQDDKVLVSDICRKFKISRVWIERLERCKALKLTSHWMGYKNKKGLARHPAIYFVSVFNRNRLIKLFKHTPKVVFVSQEKEVASSTLKMLEDQENATDSEI